MVPRRIGLPRTPVRVQYNTKIIAYYKFAPLSAQFLFETDGQSNKKLWNCCLNCTLFNSASAVFNNTTTHPWKGMSLKFRRVDSYPLCPHDESTIEKRVIQAAIPYPTSLFSHLLALARVQSFLHSNILFCELSYIFHSLLHSHHTVVCS